MNVVFPLLKGLTWYSSCYEGQRGIPTATTVKLVFIYVEFLLLQESMRYSYCLKGQRWILTAMRIKVVWFNVIIIPLQGSTWYSHCYKVQRDNHTASRVNLILLEFIQLLFLMCFNTATTVNNLCISTVIYNWLYLKRYLRLCFANWFYRTFIILA